MKKHWKTITRTPHLILYITTADKTPTLENRDSSIELDAAHRRLAHEAVGDYVLSHGVELVGPPQQLESTPANLVEIAWLREFASESNPHSVSATVYEHFEEPNASDSVVASDRELETALAREHAASVNHSLEEQPIMAAAEPNHALQDLLRSDLEIGLQTEIRLTKIQEALEEALQLLSEHSKLWHAWQDPSEDETPLEALERELERINPNILYESRRTVTAGLEAFQDMCKQEPRNRGAQRFVSGKGPRGARTNAMNAT